MCIRDRRDAADGLVELHRFGRAGRGISAVDAMRIDIDPVKACFGGVPARRFAEQRLRIEQEIDHRSGLARRGGAAQRPQTYSVLDPMMEQPSRGKFRSSSLT